MKTFLIIILIILAILIVTYWLAESCFDDDDADFDEWNSYK